MYQIVKRNGKKAVYNINKIKNAVYKAAKASGLTSKASEINKKEANGLSYKISSIVDEKIKALYKETKELVNVETIQDLIEKALIQENEEAVAKNYIIYRHQHNKIRENIKTNQKAMNMIDDYLDLSDWKVKENSNMAYSLQGLNNHIASELTKQYWKQEIYPEYISAKHDNGDFHIHDMGSLSVYCCGWDLQDLLLKGFSGVSTKVESTPAKHFDTALMQAVNFLFSLQGEAAGAMAFSNFDTLLAPFVAYDNLSYEEVYKSMETFVFNMNVPTRVGFQSPFTNITMDLTVPSILADNPVIIGGEYMDETYSEFQDEMDMINKAFAEVMLAGDSKGRVFSFPIPTYNVTEEFDWDNPVYDPIFEMTAKYGIPYWSNFINSDMDPSDVRSMCPVTGDTEVIVKSEKYGTSIRTIQSVYSSVKNSDSKYQVFANGKWHNSDIESFEPEEILEFTFSNGDTIKMDSRHLQLVRKNKNEKIETLEAKQIKKGMYVPYNIDKINNDEEYSQYSAGYSVGAYIGDGSKNGNSLIFSLSKNKVEKGVLEKLKEFFTTLGYETVTDEKENEELVFLRVKSRSNSPISWIETFVDGNDAHSKTMKNNLFSMSNSFLEGVLKGWYDTDGGNRGRIYTVSENLINDFKKLCALLGIGYNVCNEDNREGRYGDNTVYTAKFHKRKNYGEWFFTKDNYMWFKVDKIRKVNKQKYNKVYCFQVDSKDHLFTTGNGLVTHNCRLRINNKELRKRGGGLFGSSPMTGSVGVVTINMPRIGFVADTKEEYMAKLFDLMDIAKESLELKRKALERYTDSGLYPYSRYYLKDIKGRFDEYWKNHFNTIGLNGLNESILNFLGVDIGTKEGNAFAEEIMTEMRNKLREYQEETGNIFNLEATPAEGTSYRLALLDRERFGDEIIVANQDSVINDNAEPYYTNSSQLPVGYTNDPFEALSLQDNLQILYSGGTVVHLFLGENMPSIESTRKLVKTVAQNYKLPYYSITPTFSICPKHGYIAGEHEYCPLCDLENQKEEEVA